MAEEYCVFLRGINVNGIKIKMEELKEVFGVMGFLGVKTILATGNVRVSLPEKSKTGQELKTFIESELSEHFHYEAHVIIRSKKEIQDIFAVAKNITVPEGCHNYLLLCDEPELYLELKDIFDLQPHAPQEQLILAECGAFWIVPKGFTLDSAFGSKVLGNKKYKRVLTSRNINTIEKIYKFMLN